MPQSPSWSSVWVDWGERSANYPRFMEETLARNWIGTGVVVGVLLLAYLVLVRLGVRFVKRLVARSPDSAGRATTLWALVRRTVLIVLLVITFLMVFSIWGLSMAPFLAVGTVIGAALGFGAQGLVRDVLAGFFIIAEGQYVIGDTVTIAGTNGTVEDIQFRVTVLRDGEGNVHYVPNGQISVASNFTSRFAQPRIELRVASDSDMERAMEVFLDELQLFASDPEWSERITAEPEMQGVQDLTDRGVLIRARMTTVADQRWSVRREAMRRVKNRFDAEGINISELS
jgi:small-conductance mechanosensitive channel